MLWIYPQANSSDIPINPTVTPEKHEPPVLAMETPESFYNPSESSEDFESAKEVKGT